MAMSAYSGAASTDPVAIDVRPLVIGALFVKRKQLHLWLSEADHAFLLRHAAERDEAIGAIVRRLIRSWRHSVGPSATVAGSEGAVRERHAHGVNAPMPATDGRP